MDITPENKSDNEIIEKLNVIRNVASRKPAAIEQGRDKFLAQARLYRSQLPQQTVSYSLFGRLKGWSSKFVDEIKIQKRRERFAMISTITTILIALGILFGGAGATAYAAQDSLPNDVLYNIKILGEDLRLELTKDPQTELEIILDYANRRIDEIATLLMENVVVPEPTATRYQEHLNYALQLASTFDDDEFQTGLQRIRSCLEQQERIMVQAQTNMPEGVNPMMNQIRETIRERIRMVDLGLEDPLMLRQMLQQRFQFQRDGEMPPETPVGTGQPASGGNGPGACDRTCTPVNDGSGPGPGPMQTPGNDPNDTGKGPQATPDPNQNSTGPGTQSGPGEPTHTPEKDGSEPGSGDGNQPANPGTPSKTPPPNNNDTGDGGDNSGDNEKGNGKP